MSYVYQLTEVRKIEDNHYKEIILKESYSKREIKKFQKAILKIDKDISLVIMKEWKPVVDIPYY